jgi:hypothetical protein
MITHLNLRVRDDKKGRNMLQRTTIECSLKRWPSTIAQMLRLRIVWQGLLGLLVLLALLATLALLVGTSWQAHATTPVPAHVSMQAGGKPDRMSGSQLALGGPFCFSNPRTIC